MFHQDSWTQQLHTGMDMLLSVCAHVYVHSLHKLHNLLHNMIHISGTLPDYLPNDGF